MEEKRQTEQNGNSSMNGVVASGTSKSVTTGKADPVKRIIAFVIDAVISIIIGLIPFIGSIIGALYMLLRDALPIEALDYGSVGKKLLNISVVDYNDRSKKADYAASLKRNWMFALGPIMQFFMFIPLLGWAVDIVLLIVLFVFLLIELIKMFTDPEGRRFGDKMGNTIVI